MGIILQQLPFTARPSTQMPPSPRFSPTEPKCVNPTSLRLGLYTPGCSLTNWRVTRHTSRQKHTDMPLPMPPRPSRSTRSWSR
ncbi:hypothetical protein CI102_3240 [Trichoderma harzianum]|nr:hypothetical protein CI102_3240 [Trichoderma harzianum]